jgi:radical SAM family RiPP maturation amino acid epimerase
MSHTSKELNAFDFYRSMFQRRSPDELRYLAQLKRFMQCFSGDLQFRGALTEGTQASSTIFRAHGINLDPQEISPLWNKGHRTEIPVDELKEFPGAAKWTEWVGELIKFRDLMRGQGDPGAANPRFSAWRNRQIARTAGELGEANKAVIHPVLSFEISKGCSVGCWFCGFAAQRLEDVFPYTRPNSRLWRDLLEVSLDVVGSAATTAFCYHATEPSDNPDYLSFINDFRDIIGILPQTTSATPLKDVEWTRRLINLYRENRAVPLRFSILNVKTLRRIHEEFLPEELLGVELLMQQKGSMLVKGRTGKTRQSRVQDKGDANESKISADPGSIACVSGFLVNMVDRSICLTSVCPASDRWPLGYRVHHQGSFRDASGFRAVLEDAIEEHMPERIPNDQVVRFRNDLECSIEPNGFILKSRHNAIRIKGDSFVTTLGSLIVDGDRTAHDILSEIIDQGGNFLAAGATLKDLFDQGLLDDDPGQEVHSQSCGNDTSKLDKGHFF